jgi:16S rRNA processing protein RimM
MEEQILIAIIKRAHGIKGEVLAEPHTFDITRFNKLKNVTLKIEEGKQQLVTISNLRIVPQGILFSFKEITTRNESERLRGAEMYIPISERLPLPKGKIYYDEIEGMKVIDNESGEELGSVKEIREIPNADIYVLRLNDGSEKLVTSAGNEIIKVDKKKREVRVKLLADY